MRFPADSFRMEMIVLFKIVSIVGLAFVLAKINPWLAGFLLLALVSCFYPRYTRFSYVALDNVLIAMIWFMVVYHFKRTDLLLNAICIIALLNIGYLGVQYLNADPLFHPVHGTKDPLVGLMGNENFLSALLAICFPAFLRRKWAYFIPVIILGLFMAKSFGGLIAVSAGMIFYSCMKGKYLQAIGIIGGGLIVGGAILLFFHGKPNIVDRWESWLIAFKYYKQHWIFGSGIGHWKVVFANYPLYGKTWWAAAHNEMIQGTFEMGILFVVLLLGYLYHFVKRLLKQILIPATAVIVILFNSLVNFPFHIGTTAMIAVTWLGIFELTWKKIKIESLSNRL